LLVVFAGKTEPDLGGTQSL